MIRERRRCGSVARSSRSASESAVAASPLVKRDLDCACLRDRVQLRLRERAARLVEPSLPPSQLAEPRGALDERRAPAVAQHVERGGQLTLGLVPRSLLQQHGRVLRAADVEERAQLPALRELLDLVAPLGRALGVAHALARGDQVAADLADPHQVVDSPAVAAEADSSSRRMPSATAPT